MASFDLYHLRVRVLIDKITMPRAHVYARVYAGARGRLLKTVNMCKHV